MAALSDQQLQEELERLINNNDVERVLNAVAQICWSKSFLTQKSFQDKVMSKYWGKLGEDLKNLFLLEV